MCTDYSVVIKTNSAYSYLWPIINDFVKSFSSVSVLTDQDKSFKFNSNVNLYYYDINDKYPVRLKKYLNSISSDYVFLIHDVDIILNFNFKKFYEYFNLIKKYDIDRLSFGIFNGDNIICNENIAICKLIKNMSKNFLTPFDYAPSIYKKSFLLDIYSKYENQTYQTLEHFNDFQNYVEKNYNCFGIQKTDKTNLIYHRGFSYSEDFNFLHLTVKGEFLKEECYEDLLPNFLNIKEKYNLNFIKTHGYVPGPSFRL